MSAGKEIRDLNKIYLEAVYGQSAGQKLEKREKDDDAAGAPYTVTAADKKGNTPAYQGLKAGKKNVKTGKPLYKAADHLKDDKDWGYDKDGNSLNPVDIEKKKKKDDDLAGSPNVKKESYETKKKAEVLSAMKRQGRKLSDKDKDKIANKVVTSKGDTSKSDDRYAYEELNQVRKLVEKVLTPGAKLAKLRADDDLAGAPKKPWNKVRKVTDQETSQKVRDRQGTWKNEEVENDPGMEHNLEVLGMLSEKGSVAKKEIKDLQKAGKTLKGKNVAKADALLDEYIPEKEVKVKDTRRTVDAIRAYDKSKDASRDATYDTDEGDKEKAAIEKKYAAKERGEIDKDDPNWKKRKYHTGIHGEEVEILKGLLESGKLSEEEVKSILWNEGYQRDPEQQEKERKTSKQTDPSKDNFTGIGDSIADIMKQNAAMKAAAKKKTKKEGYQRNPEKGEEEERKAEKRRKESGRMPPRGDKRREDFEKWYAANVR